MSGYDLAVKLSLDAGGMMAGAAMVMARFTGIKTAAEAADASVLSHQKTLDRMNFMGANRGSRSYQYALQQQGQAATEAAVAHDKLARAQRGANMIGAGVASFGVGMAGVGVLKHWIDSAGLLEVAMNNVRLATGATDAQLQAMQRGDIKIALSNQMSLTEVETLRATAAQNNLHSIPQLNAILPELARFAEVMKVTKGYSPEQSATTGVSFAHVFSGYKAAEIAPLLDQFSRALQTTHATPNQFLTTLSGFIGLARPMYGTSAEDRMRGASDSIAMTALLGNMGQGTRGGNQLRALLTSTMDTLARPNAIHNRALHAVEEAGGGNFFRPDKHFAGYSNMLTILSNAAKAAGDPKTAAQVSRAMSTAGGASIGGLLADPLVVKLFEGIKKDVSGKGSLFSLDASQQFVNATQKGRFNQLQANMDTISALMGQKLLPAVVAVATALTQATAGIIDFIDQNQGVATFAATFVAVGTGIALLAAPVLVAAGAFAILSAAGALGTLTFAPFLAIALGIVAAIGLVALAITHWAQVLDFLTQHTGWLAIIAVVLLPILPIVSAIVAGVALGVVAFQHWGDITRTLGGAFSSLGEKVHALLLNIEALPKAMKDIPVLGGAAQGVGAAASGVGTIARGAADAAATVTSGSFFDGLGSFVHAPFASGKGGGYGIGTLPQRYPVPAGGGVGQPARSSATSGTVVHMHPGAVPVAVHFHGHQTDDAAAERIVATVQRRLSEKMRDLHRYGSLTPSGVELGFHGA